jgi:hypothetical protein
LGLFIGACLLFRARRFYNKIEGRPVAS